MYTFIYLYIYSYCTSPTKISHALIQIYIYIYMFVYVCIHLFIYIFIHIIHRRRRYPSCILELVRVNVGAHVMWVCVYTGACVWGWVYMITHVCITAHDILAKTSHYTALLRKMTYADDVFCGKRLAIWGILCIFAYYHTLSLPAKNIVIMCKDAYIAFRCRSLSAEEPLIIRLFCGKRPVKIRQRHARISWEVGGWGRVPFSRI